MPRTLKVLRWLRLVVAALLASGAACSSPNPASPPAPPAEIPAFLVIPSDLTIAVNEASASGAPVALKAQTSGTLREEIEAGVNTVTDDNVLLDIFLSPFRTNQIPVDPSVTTFETELPLMGGDPVLFKMDFRPFDLDGDGAPESCSGCTCPVGCAPDLAVCPSEAPVDQLHPICFRIWEGGNRYMAGVFDRVPTADNAQSGSFRFRFPMEGAPIVLSFAVSYDQRDPEALALDLAFAFQETESSAASQRRRDIVQQEGPEATAKKTIRLQFELSADPSGLVQYQSQFFSDLNFILLELIATGGFESPDIEDLTPPICAQISGANPVADILCSDLGLTLTPGNFPTLPELEEVLLPPFDQFSETPMF